MRFERRESTSVLLSVLAPLGALAASFIISAGIIAWSGADPISAYRHIFLGAFGTRFAMTETLTRTVPLILTGLAVTVAFRARLWNIGAEGQLYAGAVLAVVLGSGTLAWPAYLLVPFLFLTGAIAGALCLLGPTLLKTRLGVDEVVTTLLLNFVILLAVSALLDGPLKDPSAMGWPQSYPVLDELRLPLLMRASRLHVGIVLALALVVAVWFIVNKTIWGYEIRAVGANPIGARFAGLPIGGAMVRVALLSGGLAGIAGVTEVLGPKGDLTIDLSPGYGYSGIVVAMLAVLHPLGVPPAALFVAAMFVGADAMSRALAVPSYIAEVITSIALLTMLVAVMLARYRIRRS